MYRLIMRYKRGYYTRRWGIEEEFFEIEPYKIYNYYLKYKSGTLIGIIRLLFYFFQKISQLQIKWNNDKKTRKFWDRNNKGKDIRNVRKVRRKIKTNQEWKKIKYKNKKIWKEQLVK